MSNRAKACPNVNAPEWKASVQQYGEDFTWKNWIASQYPSLYQQNPYSSPVEKALHQIIPSNIAVKKLNELANASPRAASAYLNQAIYLGEGKNNYAYHEAFHAIFQNALSEQEVQDVLRAGEAGLRAKLRGEGKTLRSYIKELRELGYLSTLSDNDSIDKAVEEYLADEFQAYKETEDAKHPLRKWFEKILAYIRSLFTKQDRLQGLFDSINSGYYSGVAQATNRFSGNQTNTNPDYKLLRRSEGLYFSAEETNHRVAQLVSAYRNVSELPQAIAEKWDDITILNKIIDYARQNTSTLLASSTDPIASKDLRDLLLLYSEESYEDGSKQQVVGRRAELRDAMVNYLRTFKAMTGLRNELEDLKTDIGERVWLNAESAPQGGLDTIPSYIRMYIASTGMESDTGELLANEGVVQEDGSYKFVPIYMQKPVNVNKIYGSMLRAMANTLSETDMFARMMEYEKVTSYTDANGNPVEASNPETRVFIQRLKHDLQLDEDKTSATYMKPRPGTGYGGRMLLYQRMKLGFNRWAKNTIFQGIDPTKGIVTTHYANRQGIDQQQVQEWSVTYDDLREQSTWNAVESKRLLNEASLALTASAPYYVEDSAYDVAPGTALMNGEQKLRRDIGRIIGSLNSVGITVHPAYARYVLLKQRADRYDTDHNGDENPRAKLGPDTITESDYDSVRTLSLNQDQLLTADDLIQIGIRIGSGEKKKHLYQREAVEEGDEILVDEGVTGRLLKIARGNGAFDETIFESSWTAADGTIRYLHQDGTYNLKAAAQLRDASFVNQLVQTGVRDKNIIIGVDENGIPVELDYEGSFSLKANRLLQEGSDFRLTHGSFAIEELDGIRQRFMSEDDTDIKVISDEFKKDRQGAHYGDMTAREFSVMLLNLYGGSMKKNIKVAGRAAPITLVPQLVTIMEASKSSDVAWMPVIEGLYKGGALTDKAVNLLVNEVMIEARRIQRVAKDILSSDGKILSPEAIRVKLGYVLEDYHTGKAPRALVFSDKVASLLSPEMNKTLTEAALSGKLDTMLDAQNSSLTGDLRTNYTRLLDKEWTRLRDSGEVVVGENGEFTGPYMTSSFTKGDKDVDFTEGKLQDNVFQAITQAYLNSMSINSLMFGDQALMFKNDPEGSDPYKRAKTANAKGAAIAHTANIPELGVTSFQYSEVAIIDEPSIFSKLTGKSLDEADAQMWSSVQGIRNTLFGLGRLTPDVAKLLDKIEAGEDVTIPDLFDKTGHILSQDKMLNSYKLVYRDHSRTLKMSVVPLTKALTSLNIGTKQKPEWVARPGYEDLHSMRENMEAKGIHFVSPKTASKTMTVNKLRDYTGEGKNKRLDFSKMSSTKYNNNYMMLQLENPSNKLKNTSPTQLLHAIDIEQTVTVTDKDGNVSDLMVQLPGGRELSVRDVRANYQKAMADKSSILYQSARNEFYSAETFTGDINNLIATGQITPELAAFQERAVQTLATTGADSQLLEFFETENGIPKYDLNSDLTVGKYIDLYWSHFSNGGFSMKSPGYSAALFSHYGSSLVKEIVGIHNGVLEWRVIRRDSQRMLSRVKAGKTAEQITWKKQKEGEEFQYIPEGDWKVGDVFIDKLAYNKPLFKNGKLTGYASEMILPHQTGQQMSVDQRNLKRDANPEISEAIRYNFGNRIPLQDKQSMLALEWVDTMPAFYGSTAIFPPEVIELSGADFDIDKEYITAPDVYQDENGDFKRYGDGETFKQRFEEYRMWHLEHNRYLRMKIQELRQGDDKYATLKREIEALNLAKADDVAVKNALGDEIDKLTSDIATRNGDQLLSEEDYEVSASMIGDKIEKQMDQKVVSAKIKALTEQVQQIKSNIRELTNGYFEIAMKEMGLPDTITNFELLANTYDPNPGSANNTILDGFLGMLTNDGIRKGIADQPATEDYLKNQDKNPLFDYIGLDGEKHNVFDPKPKTPTDFFGTHINAKKKIQTGKNNIGIIVSQMVQMSIIKKAGLQLRTGKYYVSIDGKTYTDTTLYKEWQQGDTNVPTGERLMNVMSTMISAATDENKNGNNARFNINEGVLKVMASLIDKGVRMEVMIALVNQPAIQAYEALQTAKKGSLKTQAEQKASKGDNQETKNAIDSILKGLESTEFMGVDLNAMNLTGKEHLTFQQLANILSSPRELNVLTAENMAQVLINDKLGELSEEQKLLKAAVQIAGLELYIRMGDYAEQKAKFADILALNKKINGFTTVDKALQSAKDMGLIDGQIEPAFPFDVRYALTGKSEYKETTAKIGKRTVAVSNGEYVHSISIQYLKQLKEVNQLAKLNFLHRTQLFQDVYNGVLQNLMTKDGKSSIGKDAKGQLEKDLRSFIQIAAYKSIGDFTKDIRLTLSKALLYDVSGDVNVIAIMKKLRRIAPQSPLVKYLTPYDKKYKGAGKTTGEIHTVEANTRNKMSDTQMSNLMNAFEQLWVTPETHDLAGALIDYLLVKDAFQFKNRSISKIIPVSAMGNILKAGKLAQNLMLVEIPMEPTVSSIESLRRALVPLRNTVNDAGQKFLTDEEFQYVLGLISSKEEGVAKHLWRPKPRENYVKALNFAMKKLLGYDQQGLYNQFLKLVAGDKYYQFKVPIKSLNKARDNKGAEYNAEKKEFSVDFSRVIADPNGYKRGTNEAGEDVYEFPTTAELRSSELAAFITSSNIRMSVDKTTGKNYFNVPKYIRLSDEDGGKGGTILELVGRTYEGVDEYNENGLPLPVGASEFYASRFTYKVLPSTGTSNSRPMANLEPYVASEVTTTNADPIYEGENEQFELPPAFDDFTDETEQYSDFGTVEEEPTMPVPEPASQAPKVRKTTFSIKPTNPLSRQPQDLNEAILQYFVSGGKIRVTDFSRYGDPNYMIGGKRGNPYIGYVVGDSKAESVDTIARGIIEDGLGRSIDQFDEQDVIRQIIDTIVSFNGSGPKVRLTQYQAREAQQEQISEEATPEVRTMEEAQADVVAQVTETPKPKRVLRKPITAQDFSKGNDDPLEFGTNANLFNPTVNPNATKRCN